MFFQLKRDEGQLAAHDDIDSVAPATVWGRALWDQNQNQITLSMDPFRETQFIADALLFVNFHVELQP